MFISLSLSQTNSTNYLRTHDGQKQRRAPLFKRIKQVNFIICFLHCVLRTTGKLFKTFIAERCTTPEIATQVTSALKYIVEVGLDMKSTGKGPQKRLLSTSFTGVDKKKGKKQ